MFFKRQYLRFAKGLYLPSESFWGLGRVWSRDFCLGEYADIMHRNAGVFCVGVVGGCDFNDERRVK